MGKCSNKISPDKEVKRGKVLACYRLNWLDQSEHVREYNWENLDPSVQAFFKTD